MSICVVHGKQPVGSNFNRLWAIFPDGWMSPLVLIVSNLSFNRQRHCGPGLSQATAVQSCLYTNAAGRAFPPLLASRVVHCCRHCRQFLPCCRASQASTVGVARPAQCRASQASIAWPGLLSNSHGSYPTISVLLVDLVGERGYP